MEFIIPQQLTMYTVHSTCSHHTAVKMLVLYLYQLPLFIALMILAGYAAEFPAVWVLGQSQRLTKMRTLHHWLLMPVCLTILHQSAAIHRVAQLTNCYSCNVQLWLASSRSRLNLVQVCLVSAQKLHQLNESIVSGLNLQLHAQLILSKHVQLSSLAAQFCINRLTSHHTTVLHHTINETQTNNSPTKTRFIIYKHLQ